MAGRPRKAKVEDDTPDPAEVFAPAALIPEAWDRGGDFKAVFGTPQGKRVLWQILAWAGMYAQFGVAVDQPDPAFRAAMSHGAQNLAKRILAARRETPKARAARSQRTAE